MSDHESRIAELERRVTELEKAPKIVPTVPGVWPPTYKLDECRKCGIKLSGVMSYSCPQKDCPTGLGSPHC